MKAQLIQLVKTVKERLVEVPKILIAKLVEDFESREVTLNRYSLD